MNSFHLDRLTGRHATFRNIVMLWLVIVTVSSDARVHDLGRIGIRQLTEHLDYVAERVRVELKTQNLKTLISKC